MDKKIESVRVKPTKRNLLLDLLRISACLFVLVFHWNQGIKDPFQNFNLFSPMPWPDSNNFFLNLIYTKGYVGVDIFFILSGFVIAKYITNQSITLFVKQRFLRLFPTYVISIAFAIIPVYFALKPKFNIYFSSLTFQGFALNEFPLVSTSWTLLIEIQFYLIFGFFIIIKDLLKETRFEFISRYSDQKMLFVLFTAYLFIIQYGSFSESYSFYYLFSSYPYLIYFISGVIFAHSELVSNRVLRILLTSFLIGCNVYALTNRMGLGKEAGVMQLIFVILIYLILHLSKYEIFNGNNSKVFKIVGILSLMTYPIYLLHQQFGSFLIALFQNTLSMSLVASNLLGFSILLVISFSIVTFGDRSITKLIN